MRILGIDYGLKKIGLAVGDTESRLAEPLGVIRIGDGRWEVGNERIKKICQEQGIEKIVIGLPESGIVSKIKDFAEELRRITNLPVVYQEEVLTSQDAVAKMIEGGKKKKFRKEWEDAVAAAIILQNWIDQINV